MADPMAALTKPMGSWPKLYGVNTVSSGCLLHTLSEGTREPISLLKEMQHDEMGVLEMTPGPVPP